MMDDTNTEPDGTVEHTETEHTENHTQNAEHAENTENTENTETIGDADQPAGTAIKDPSDWVTGDEDMTGAQKSYLDTLAREAGEELPANLTKAEASEHIDRLQEKTGRGR